MIQVSILCHHQGWRLGLWTMVCCMPCRTQAEWCPWMCWLSLCVRSVHRIGSRRLVWCPTSSFFVLSQATQSQWDQDHGSGAPMETTWWCKNKDSGCLFWHTNIDSVVSRLWSRRPRTKERHRCAILDRPILETTQSDFVFVCEHKDPSEHEEEARRVLGIEWICFCKRASERSRVRRYGPSHAWCVWCIGFQFGNFFLHQSEGIYGWWFLHAWQIETLALGSTRFAPQRTRVCWNAAVVCQCLMKQSGLFRLDTAPRLGQWHWNCRFRHHCLIPWSAFVFGTIAAASEINWLFGLVSLFF